MKNKSIQILGLALLLLVVILPSWLIENDRVINVDEPRWIIRGANFYYAVTHGEFDKTIFEYHPGVTNMWIVGTAMHIYFPEYRGFGQGYFDPLKQKFEEFMREQGKEALDVARVSRYIHAGVLAILALTAFLLLQLLIDPKAAFLSVALAALAPFYLGHSRLMNLEGMLSLFALVSFLGLQVYLNKDRKMIYLLLSGMAFGLAQLTKSSSIVVIGLVGLMLFVGLFKQTGSTIQTKFWDAVKTFSIWLVAAAVTYFVLWPGMWVAPGKMLTEVYGNAFSYAFQGARLDVTKQLDPDTFGISSGGSGILQFLQLWAESSTLITWLGLIFIVFLLFDGKVNLPAPIKSTLLYLTVLGGLFVLMFGLAQGRDSQHYILTSYIAFDVMAGIGWYYLWTKLQTKWVGLKLTYTSILFFGALIGIQIASGLPYAPYYFIYKHPFATVPATYGYGEGYSEAADYLAQKPNAKELRAYVYSGMGTFSFFFPGETMVLKRVNVLNSDFVTITEELRSSDYLVLYPITRAKQPETEKILGELEGVVSPEKIITINGREYIQIYRVADIPESVYEALLRKHEP
jgi:Dolichyl-phosphate-mannose-protein mannosyltransferase